MCLSRRKKLLFKNGFTLIEVLLATVIMSFIGIAAYSMLFSIKETEVASNQKTQENNELQRALIIFDNDFNQIISRKYSSEEKININPIIIGLGENSSDDVGVSLIRGGWVNPNYEFRRSQFLKVKYYIENKQLMRKWYPFVDTTDNTPFYKQILINNILSFEIESYEKGLWFQEWKKENTPQALKIIINIEGIGRIEKIYLLPESEV